MRGRRTAVAVLLVGALAAACSDDDSSPPAATPTDPATMPMGAEPGDSGVPEFEGELQVRVVTGLRVFGRGCRQLTAHDACSADGTKTYTWAGDRHRVTVTSARMHPDAERRAWVVDVRFAARDREEVQAAAGRAGGAGGYALVLDAGTGNALQAAEPTALERGRIVVRGLEKPIAWDLVSTYVSAATGH